MQKIIILSAFSFGILSCSNEKSSKVQIVSANDTVINNAINTDSNLHMFSISLTSQSLTLRQWDSTIDLKQELGTPVSERTIKLDENSDTFSGSFEKKLIYDGLQLGLFSPRQNGKTFWVQEIIITKPKYYTVNEITIGDSLAKVKKAYPSLKLFPGNTDNMFYVSNPNYEYSIEFEMENEKVKKIRLYYMMQ